MSRRFVGVYSYPRSGNTWTRSILSHLFFSGDLEEVPDIHENNNIFRGGQVQYRGQNVGFFKSHQASKADRIGQTPIPHVGYVYIYRHPLDVFLSYMNYLYWRKATAQFDDGVPRSVEELRDLGRLEPYLQRFEEGPLDRSFKLTGSYRQHVTYWLDFKPEPEGFKRVLRYEDLAETPAATLARALDVFELAPDRIEQAVARAQGATRRDGGFYWRQSAGSFAGFLSDDALAGFRRRNADLLARLGYA